MKKTWTIGLSEQLAEEVKGNFKSSALIRARLSAILNERIVTKRTEATSKTSYDSPSWAYLQADANGYERALNEVISLLSENNG